MERVVSVKHKDKAQKWVACSFGVTSSSQSTQEDEAPTKSSRKRPRMRQNKKSDTSAALQDTQSTWLNKFAPKDMKDLAVHSKKIVEVKSWILDSLEKRCSSSNQCIPMLLLTGPSGSGKTETVRVIAKENGINLMEWVDMTSNTPYISWSGEPSYLHRRKYEDSVIFPETQMTTFSRFLLQASKYSDVFSKEMTKKVVLIDDFPNAFYRSPGNFHSILKAYATRCQCPLVFIVTESGKEETFEHELFPRQLQAELGMTHICFNAVAPTIISKALNNICDKLQGSGIKLPTKVDLDNIVRISNGDIRTAINTLEMICTSNSCVHEILYKEKVNTNEKKSAFTEHTHDSGLGLFHLLGKVLYCKRSNDGGIQGDSKKALLVEDPEDILRHISVSSEYFILYLHQNFMPFINTLEDAIYCSERISEADVWTAEWTVRDLWEPHSVSHAVRGLMYHLPSKKSNRQWRSLEKPEWFSVKKKIRDNSYALESSLKGKPFTPRGVNMHGVSLGELTTVQLPFLSISDPSLYNAGLLKPLNELSTFSGVRQSHSDLIIVQTDVYNTHETQSELAVSLAEYKEEELIIEDVD